MISNIYVLYSYTLWTTMNDFVLAKGFYMKKRNMKKRNMKKAIITDNRLECILICSTSSVKMMLYQPFNRRIIFNLNFHSLEVVARWRDPQLQVSENYSDLTKWRSSVFKYCWLMSHFIFNMFKEWYLINVLIKNEKPNICDTGG